MNHPKKLTDLVDDLDKEIVKLYRFHRDGFLLWAEKHYSLSSEELTDVYQDAIIILYEAVKNNRLQSLNSSLKTYLFGIAKNLIRERFKKLSKEKNQYGALIQQFQDEQKINSEQEIHLQQCIDQLTDICKKIVRLYYFYGMSAQEIKEEMNYNNAEVVRSQKVRCMKKLRALVLKQLK